MVNITKYADSHGYRIRNMHDGFPVPPSNQKKGTRCSKGYQSARSRMDAIICADGYIDKYSNYYFGWFLYTDNKNKFNRRLKQILKTKAVAIQVGDTEAYGYVNEANLKDVLKVLRPRKWRKNNKKWDQIQSSKGNKA